MGSHECSRSISTQGFYQVPQTLAHSRYTMDTIFTGWKTEEGQCCCPTSMRCTSLFVSELIRKSFRTSVDNLGLEIILVLEDLPCFQSWAKKPWWKNLWRPSRTICPSRWMMFVQIRLPFLGTWRRSSGPLFWQGWSTWGHQSQRDCNVSKKFTNQSI